MAELSEGKIFRTSLQSLLINVSNDELAYRLKYLPDPRRLSDDKIVCTVCSISLASRVRKGKDIYVHAILGVLVCKHCCNFYGDGIFSTDEDGDDKYCRWCGQGGTLYLCSKCNCGFCKKCMTKNMKNSALKEIERDDWKCLICVPRPIFGSRAVCWASRELNSSARKTNVMKKRLEEEKLLLADKENYEEDNREFTKSAKNRESKAKKRAHNSEDSDSSTVFIPTKKRKEDKKNDKSLNGGIKKHRRKHGKSSSDNESSDDHCNSKSGKTKRKNEDKSQSQSSEDSSSNFRKKRTKKKLRKKTNSSSNESSDCDENVPKSKSLTKKTNKSFKTKMNVSKEKKDSKAYSSSSDSMKEQKSKKKKLKSSRENLKIDSSSEENQRKSDSEENNSEEKSKKDTSSEQNLKNSYCMEKEDILDISVVKESNCSEEADNVSSIKKVNGQEEKVETVTCVKQKNTEGQLAKVISSEKENPPLEKSRPENSEEAPSTETPTCIVEKSLPNLEEQSISEETQSAQQIVSDNEWTLSYKESSTESNEKLNLSQEDEVNLKVELAIEWLGDVANDIADLGNLITERTTKFGKKKVNLENLQSYEDVLLTLGKLKQLIKGIHTNYNQIEDGLEDKLKSWKILAGLDKSNFEEQSYDEEEGQIETESKSIDTAKLSDDIKTEVNRDPEVDKNELLNENSVDPHFQPVQDENEICSEVSSVNFSREDKVISKLPEIANTCNESDTLDNECEDIISKGVEGSSIKATELEHVESNSILPQGDESILEGNNIQTELSIKQELEITDVDVAIVDSQLSLKSNSSKYIWPGLWSSESDSDQNEETELTFKSSGDNDRLKEPEINDIEEKKSSSETNVLDDKKDLDSCDINMSLVKEESIKVDDKDAENLEALQELLETSESEPETESSDSDSDDSDDLQLDDSDLDDIPKPKKVVVKKSSKNKETKRKDEIENTSAKNKGEIDEEEKDSDEEKTKEIEKKPQEPLDSEAEIDMLTDLSKLKKKSVPKIVEQRNSDESSSEDSYEDDSNEEPSKKKKRKKYNTEVKKKREQERNELFGFLHGGSSEEDEVDISKNDLDVMEDQYVSESSDSMTLEAFSRKMNKKWRELENEQDQLNLQRLLQSSDSEEGPAGDDNLEFDVSDEDEKKKKKKGEKVKDGKINEDEGCVDTDAGDDKIKEEEDVTEEAKDKEESDQGYEQFLEDMVKNRTKFTGLGSSSEGEIDIKEEPVSDRDSKVKKELKDSGEGESSDSNSSADLFLDLTKKRSAKKPTWRHHKLLRMKLSDTDTSDEERLWQRRLEREKKKKERGDSPKKSFGREKNRKEENGSDKENKKVKKEKHKEDDEANSSSTLEMSSTESSGSEIFQKKKKKKKESSDSDVAIISDVDKKKKKKKKKLGLFDLSGDSSDESEEDDDDVIDITQKSSQGESPGKGGRKNIRKVLTKHELAAATKAAAKEEEERKKRIAARQKLFNEMFEIKEAEILEKLVLDFDPETKTELISVDKDLVTKMKPHQAKGVKFMWDSCFESLSQLKTKKGSGCILAHCMGLGKTFQVVSLVHTILTNKDTSVRTVLVVCPLSTVLNWYNEFDKWLEDVSGGRNINIYHLTKFKKAHERSRQLSLWHRTGGVMILGYEMFRILANASSKKFRLMHMEVFQKTLIDPGADLVVCDEGHMLKNESTVLSKAMSRIRTLRRIVLTGTPMQNNLKEYHCMVQFVKPNLLGTRKEFLNQFVNPITNGQFVDSTEADVKVMKRRAHVLHKMLEGLVQRFDYSVLTPFLPPKHEYVISLRLSDIQVKLYQFYLDHFCQRNGDKRLSSQLFQDWQVLGRIWTHPRVLKMGTDKAEKEKQETSSDTEEGGKKLRSQKTINDFFKKKKRSSSSNSSKQESEDEGSIKNFINEKSSSSSLSLSSTNSSSSDDDDNGKGEKKDKKEKKKNKKLKKNEKENKVKSPVSNPVKVQSPEVITVEPIEINLISSEEEEEDGDKREASKEVKEQNDSNKENEDKTNDSGIEDQEGKTGDEPDTETITVEEETNNKDDKEKENPQNTEINEKEKGGKCESEPLERRGAWWKDIIEPQHLEDINQSAKLVVLFAILRECELIEDKVLVFSQSLFSLDLIEYFLEKVDKATEENRLDESLGNQAGCWQKGLDYFRLDGSSSSESRSQWCKSFNREDNPRARLFLISTRAGGLGINLTGANRVVIFDASWNPSHDIQSIFRIYRFGQKKPCYVYRFVAHGTMEEKVYDRQVAKQSLSSRVVDEQQVHRHFSMNDLNELYRFTPPQERTEKPTPVLPKDRLMAELLTQYNDWIEKYHEHDSLLENIAEEELNEEERKLAWEDYENEKKQGFQPQAPGTGLPNFPGVANQAELFRRSLQLKFPRATEVEMNAMLQTLMYQVNYRAVSQPVGAHQTGQRMNPGPSQQMNAGSSQSQDQNFRMRAQQSFNAQRNHLYQKYGTQAQSQPTQQQRVGNTQVNQSRIGNGQINPQRVGNGQIRRTNRTNQEHLEEMRRQQQANLARIQNQRRFQQQVQPQPARQRNNVMMNPQANNGVQRVMSNRLPQQQVPKIQPGMWNSNRLPPVNTNRVRQGQQGQNFQNNRKQTQVTPITNNVKPTTSNSQSHPLLKKALSPTTHIQKPTTSNPQTQSLLKKALSPKAQIQREQIKRRIEELKRRTSQPTTQQKIVKSGPADPVHQQQLEEMKKRYKASRRMRPVSAKSSEPISVVELDD